MVSSKHEFPEMDPARTDSIRDLLLDTLRDEPARKARQRRRIAIGGGVAGLAAAVGITAAAVLSSAAPVSNTDLVHCLSVAERNADGSYPGSQATIATPSGHGLVDDAVALCSEMWRQGVLGGSYDPTQPTKTPGSVPAQLVVCVMPDGSAAVVPGRATAICQQIGLAPLDG